MTATDVESAIGQTDCIEAYYDGLIGGTGAVAAVVVPTHVRSGDIRRHFAQQQPSRTRVRKSADEFGLYASTAVHLGQEIERAYRPDAIAGNMPEGSLIEKPAGRCLSYHWRRFAVIVMTG